MIFCDHNVDLVKKDVLLTSVAETSKITSSHWMGCDVGFGSVPAVQNSTTSTAASGSVPASQFRSNRAVSELSQLNLNSLPGGNQGIVGQGCN